MARMRILLLALAAILVLGACTAQEPEFSPEDQMAADDVPEDTGEGDGEGEGDGDAPAGDVAGTWVAIDIDYSDSPSEVPTGATVELVNEGGIVHDVVLEEAGDLEILLAEGGETDTATLDVDPGEYTYYCSIPGHRQAGMEGTFTVTE
jgi:plastocyanin